MIKAAEEENGDVDDEEAAAGEAIGGNDNIVDDEGDDDVDDDDDDDNDNDNNNNSNTKRWKEGDLLACRTQLGTALIPYPWIGNSYSSSISRERRGRYSVVLLSFVWFPLDNILFIAPNVQC